MHKTFIFDLISGTLMVNVDENGYHRILAEWVVLSHLVTKDLLLKGFWEQVSAQIRSERYLSF
jgi:hypothetical protein